MAKGKGRQTRANTSLRAGTIGVGGGGIRVRVEKGSATVRLIPCPVIWTAYTSSSKKLTPTPYRHCCSYSTRDPYARDPNAAYISYRKSRAIRISVSGFSIRFSRVYCVRNPAFEPGVAPGRGPRGPRTLGPRIPYTFLDFIDTSK